MILGGGHGRDYMPRTIVTDPEGRRQAAWLQRRFRETYGHHAYHGPENRQPLMFRASKHTTAIRIGWIYVDAAGWPRIEADPWMI